MTEDYDKKVIEYAEVAYNYVDEVCSRFGPRRATGEAERNAAEDLKKKLSEFSDEVIYEEFTARPDLYPGGLIKVGTGLTLIGMLFIFLKGYFPFVTAGCILLGLLVIFEDLFLMKNWFGFLFKKGTSQNVFGKILPRNAENKPIRGKIKIIMGGHIDSANMMKIVNYEDKMVQITLAGLGYVFFSLIISLLKGIFVNFIGIPVYYRFGYILITPIDIVWIVAAVPGIPLLIFLVYCYTGNITVAGANDNLIGVGLSYAIGKYFATEKRPKNVELWVGGFGSEECGERGSGYFVKLHGAKGELDNAYAVIPESCGAGSELAILTGEKMHFATHSPEVYNKLYEAYERFRSKTGLKVLPCKIAQLPFAASDAGRFSLAGYKASTVLAYDGKLMKPANWHAASDIPENLDKDVIAVVFGILMEYVNLMDEEAGNNNHLHR